MALVASVLVACGGGGGDGDGISNVGDVPPTDIPGWQGSQLLDGAGSNDSTDVHASLNAEGVGHAVWSRRVNNVDSIFFSRYVNGAWSSAEMIAAPGAAAVATGTTPQVATLPSGDALVVWLDGTRVMFTRSSNGQWQDPAALQAGAGALSHLRMATDGVRNAVTIWKREGVVFASSFSGGALESGIVRISDNAVDPDDEIDVAMDSSGRGLALWVEEAIPGDPTNKVVKSRLIQGGVWAVAAQTPSGTINGSALELAVTIDVNEGAAAVWTRKHAGGSVSLGAANGSGTTWGPSKTLSDVGFVVVDPDVARGPDGQVMVVFARRALNDNRFDVLARPALNFGTLMAVETDDVGNAQAPKIAFDTAGRAIVVWMQSDGTRMNVLFNRVDRATGQWGTPQAIESDDVGDALDGPVLAVNASGRALAAWKHRVIGADGEHAGVMANTFE